MADIVINNLEQDGERRQFAGHGYATLANAGAVSGDKATDLLELRGDLPGDEAFFG